jgi:tetratricopeptide (TPR) repeat protein
VLSQPTPRSADAAQTSPIAIEPVHLAWDQLPPAENLQQRAETPTADNAVLDELSSEAQIIQSPPLVDQAGSKGSATSPPTTQEAEASHSSTDDSHASVLRIPCIHDLAGGAPTDSIPAGSQLATISLPTNGDELATVVSDADNSAESWLAQAQQAATGAESTEELSAVIELCDRGLHCTPTAEQLSSLRLLSAWAHNRRGEIRSDSQHPDAAIQDFQTAISMDPHCSLAIHNRAVSLAQRNQYAAALRDFNRVIELNPGLAVAYRNRAELLAALGRMQEAVADYNQAIASLPEDASLLRARARAYQRLGDFADATADVDRAIQLSPHDPETLTQRGRLAAEQGKFEQALEDFRGAIAIDANWAEAYRCLAWLQATSPDHRFRNPQNAIESAEHAAKLSDPDDYLVLDTLAAANASAGHFDQAINFQQKALAAVPRDLSPPLEERLDMYQHGKAYSGNLARGPVRTVSHETPASDQSTTRPSPVSRQTPR